MSRRSKDPKIFAPRWLDIPVRVLLMRFIRYSLAILFVCYVGLLIHSRTKGFAYLAGEQIRDIVGLPVAIKKSSLDAMLQLRLLDLATTNDVSRAGYVEAESFELAWTPWSGIREIVVSGIRAEALFLKDKGWKPSLFSAIGTSPLLGEISRKKGRQGDTVAEEEMIAQDREEGVPVAMPIARKAMPSYSLRLKNLTIRFRTPEDETLARLDGATVMYEPGDTRTGRPERLFVAGWFEWPARKRPRQEICVEALKTEEETRIIQARVDADLLEVIEQSIRSHLP